ncbi:hypothetical protein D5086_026896 [Populus alba]|uniref:Uncharacterized protein n=1 Tax=Populus alba TaxID=43335 RepID=A0ACC4B4M3_POPAL
MHLQQGITDVQRVVSSPEKDCQKGKHFNNSVKGHLDARGGGPIGRNQGAVDGRRWMEEARLFGRKQHPDCGNLS